LKAHSLETKTTQQKPYTEVGACFIWELSLAIDNQGLIQNTAPHGRAYFPSLDGLRALSFFGVFLWHYMALPCGWAGVDVFFVLSGFLITGILYDTCDDPHRVRNFYIRRTLRIFPLYYGVLLGIFLLSPLLHWAWTWHWIAWPLYLGNFLRFLYPHLNNGFVSAFADAQLISRNHPRVDLRLGHFWTLCVEEQFYLLWPWIVFTVRDRRKLIVICVACIILVPIARMFAMAHMPEALISGQVVLHSTPFRFDTLLVGALIALLYRGPARDRMQKAAQATLVVAALCSLMVVVYWFRFHSVGLNNFLVGHTWLLSFVALFAGALMLRTIIPGTIPYRLCNLRWLRLTGTVSYGAYVFHDIPHSEYDRMANHYFNHGADVIAAVFGFVMTLALAFLSYHFFELRILRLKDRFTSGNDGRAFPSNSDRLDKPAKVRDPHADRLSV
jgi:peptidoglycan/LPS O-acetylase OafA/YrhL